MTVPWEKYAAPQSASQEGAGAGIGKFARAALKGASFIPYAFADAATQAVNLGTEGINKVAGTDIPALQYPSVQRDQTLDRFFPTDKTLADKIGSGATEFVATLPSTVAIGKALPEAAALAEKIPQQVTMATIGGGAGGVAKHYAPDNPAIQIAAQIGGTLLGGKGHAVAVDTAEAAARSAALPTTEQIKSASQSSYKAAEDAGAIYKPQAIKNMTTELESELADMGVDKTLHPKIVAVLNRLNDAGNENISLKGIEILRRVAGNAAKSQDASERMMADHIIDKIDDMVLNAKPDDILQGNADEAVVVLNKARGLWSTMKKADTIETVMDRAKIDAASTNSGGNLQNKIKQGFGAILKDPRKSRGFDADELAAMRQIVDGKFGENTLRTLGRLAPSSNSWLGILATLGGAGAGGLPGAVIGAGVPLVGSLAKAAATGMAKSSVRNLDTAVRQSASPQEMISQRLGGQQQQPLNPYVAQIIQRLIASQQGGAPGAQPQLGVLPSAASGPWNTNRQGTP